MKRVSRLALMAVAISLLLGTWAQAQVIKQLPADSLMVLKISRLQDTSKKVAALLQKMSVDMLNPDLADPLGALQKLTNFQQGIDKTGEAAVAMLNKLDGREPPILILIPVSDFKAFVGNFADAKQEDGFSVINMPGGPGTLYVADWGKYAALAADKTLLAKKGEGITVAGVAAKELEAKDLVVFFNMPAIRTTLLPKFKENRQRAIDEITQGFSRRPGAPAGGDKYAPVVKAAVEQAMNIAEGFLQDAQAVTFSVNLVPAGINTRLMADFDPNSYAGKLMQQTKKTDQPLLAGLPAGKYLAYGGGVQDPQVGIKVMDDLLAPIVKQIQAMGDDGKPLLAYISAIQGQMGSLQGDTMGLVVPAAPGQGIVQGVGVFHGDAKALATAQKQGFEATQEMMKVFAGPAAESMKMTFTPNAKTIDGVSLDQVQNAPADNAPQEMAMMMKMMYGPNGLNVLQGVVDEKTYISVLGGDDAWAAAAIAAAKTNEDSLDKTDLIKAVNAQLPANRAGVFYFAVDNVIKTAIQYVPFPGRNKLRFQGDMPPIGVAVTTEGAALSIDGHIPGDMLEKVVAGFLSLLSPGGNPGGPNVP